MSKPTGYKFEFKPIVAGERQLIDVDAVVKRYEERHLRWLQSLRVPREYFGERKK